MNQKTLSKLSLNVKLMQKVEHIRLTSLKQTPSSFYESVAIYFAGGLSRTHSASEDIAADYLSYRLPEVLSP